MSCKRRIGLEFRILLTDSDILVGQSDVSNLFTRNLKKPLNGSERVQVVKVAL